MSRATADDQLRFLLSCVRHANGGRIDFVEVANECGIVSKGAAAKRFERLMKTSGIVPSTAEKTVSTNSREKSKSAIAKTAAAKRRKIEGERFDMRDDDQMDVKPFISRTELETRPHVKSEAGLGHAVPHHQPLSSTASIPSYASATWTPTQQMMPFSRSFNFADQAQLPSWSFANLNNHPYPSSRPFPSVVTEEAPFIKLEDTGRGVDDLSHARLSTLNNLGHFGTYSNVDPKRSGNLPGDMNGHNELGRTVSFANRTNALTPPTSAPAFDYPRPRSMPLEPQEIVPASHMDKPAGIEHVSLSAKPTYTAHATPINLPESKISHTAGDQVKEYILIND